LKVEKQSGSELLTLNFERSPDCIADLLGPKARERGCFCPCAKCAAENQKEKVKGQKAKMALDRKSLAAGDKENDEV